MKSLKYFAGLFDADGSFDIRPVKREGYYTINMRAALYQKSGRDEPLQDFAEQWGVTVKDDGRGCSIVCLQGSTARRFMEQVKQHLVCKKNVVEYLLSLDKLKVSKEELKILRQSIKEARVTQVTEKNFPSRQWMAGYVDGDGCITSSFRKSDGNLEFKLSVVSHFTQCAGLFLMKKFFKGHITEQKDVLKWSVTLSQTKCEEVLGYFVKHSRIKRDQIEYVLGIVRSGSHFRRRGATYNQNYLRHTLLQKMKCIPATTKS